MFSENFDVEYHFQDMNILEVFFRMRRYLCMEIVCHITCFVFYHIFYSYRIMSTLKFHYY
jgi:hypothetical protein